MGSSERSFAIPFDTLILVTHLTQSNLTEMKKDISYTYLETKRQKRKSSVTKNELFRSLIQQASHNHILFDYVIADNWFGSKSNMHFIHGLKKRFGLRFNLIAGIYNLELEN